MLGCNSIITVFFLGKDTFFFTAKTPGKHVIDVRFAGEPAGEGQYEV